MKFLYLIIVWAPWIVCSQTDEINLQKYWKFRSDFVEQYVKIGPGQGESLPAGIRSPGTCVDNASEWANIEYGTMHWGDGTIRHGHYLGLLATEYALRKKYNLELKGILNELYYALNAIDRLDAIAEPALNDIYFTSDFYGESLNGVYLREDIPEDFCKNWYTEPMHMGCVNSVYYENNNIAKINDPDVGFLVKQKTSYQNVPSLDQMSSLMVGLSLVHKLVDNVFVKPTPSDTGFKLYDEAIAIVDRMISYASSRNWEIIDINGWPVGNGGGDLTLASGPLLAAAERIVGNTDHYSNKSIRRLQTSMTVQYCLTGYGLSASDRESACESIHFYDLFENKAWKSLQSGVPAGKYNNQDNSEFMKWLKGGIIHFPVKRFRWIWTKIAASRFPNFCEDLGDDGQLSALPWPLNKINIGKDVIKHYNNTIMFNLGVVSGWWDSTEVNKWADITENRQLELINSVLYNQTPVMEKSFYQAYLNSMKPEGGYRLKGSNCCPSTDELLAFQSDGWASEYRWTHPNESMGESGPEGIFSGMDYMLFHNLYYLLFADNLPDFVNDYHCFCEDQVKIVNEPGITKSLRDASDNLNKKLRHLPSCHEDVFSKVNHSISTSIVLEPKFSNYTDLGIETTRYLMKSATIQSSGEVLLQSNLVINKGAVLTIKGGGKVKATNGNIHLTENAIVMVYGDLALDSNSRMLLGAKSKVILKPGARLFIEESAEINSKEGAIIEMHEGAELMVKGSENERQLKNVVRKY